MNQEKDIRRLNLLGILHYVLGGFVAAFAFVETIAFAIIGVIVTIFSLSENIPPPSEWRGVIVATSWIAFVFLAISVALTWCLAICLFKSGRKLRQRKGRTFSKVIACIEFTLAFLVLLGLIGVPSPNEIKIGFVLFYVAMVILGAFTLITLNKDSVKELYQVGK